jgi:hypothetical protein
MDSFEFSPYAYFSRMIRLWWVLALATLLGGALGYLFHTLRSPLYEATATYVVTIDLDRFPIQDIREDMLQYNEDLALNTTKAVLLSPEVQQVVLTQLEAQGISLTSSDLLKHHTIERKHDLWELRYRNPDPGIAHQVANTWADAGYKAMLAWQQAGKAPSYLIFNPPNPAEAPQEPVLYDRNRVMFAGAVIGFILGIVISGLIRQIGGKPYAVVKEHNSPV